MSEHDETNLVPPALEEQPVVSGAAAGNLGLAGWMKRLLACNPFYLVSAALLLFGVYRVSNDPGFLSRETAQLAFNFGSLQFYELLLVGTAIFLARRSIWYDSTLLVALENLLLLVPFLLISQAGLIDRSTVGWICILAAGLVLVRFGLLKRFFGELNLPNRVLGLGLLMLAVNVGLLVAYRSLQEDRNQVWGPAYVLHEWTWMLALPAVAALGNFLPKAKEVGSLLPQHRWLPAGLFVFWLTGTSVHLYCLSYVYDFELRRELVVPSLWVLAWTASWRISLWISARPVLQQIVLAAPCLVAIAAAQHGNRVFLALMLLNAAAYGVYAILHREQRFVRHLVAASLVIAVGGLPQQALHWMAAATSATPDRGFFLVAAALGCLVLYSGFSRVPWMGLGGAVLAGIMVGMISGDPRSAWHWMLQAGFAFALLHSLRWDDAGHRGAATARIVVSVLWVAHAWIWTGVTPDWWMVCSVAAAVLAVYFAARFFRGQWEHLILPVSAVLVVLSGPGHLLVGVIRTAPSGLLAIAGSFFLFAAGTAAALLKHRWHPQPRTS